MNWDNMGRVRIIHFPTGEITECNHHHRSHWRNRAMAMKMLKGKLLALRDGMGRKDHLVRSYELPRDEDILDGKVDITTR